MTDEPYRPIDCSLHDRLEDAATLRRSVTIRYATDGGAEAEASGERIADIVVRGGAEYLRLASGLELRLDRIVALDGRSFRPEGC